MTDLIIFAFGVLFGYWLHTWGNEKIREITEPDDDGYHEYHAG